MSKLLKPTEYAQAEGISRQAVYAKIKKGVLNSKLVDGKIYILLEEPFPSIMKQDSEIEKKTDTDKHLIDVKELLESKEQTISILKESISDLKQTNTEINTTLRGEIELLKQVFSEMRNLYVKQVDYMSSEKHFELEDNAEKIVLLKEEEGYWITLEEFFERSKIKKEKKKTKIEKRLTKAYRKDDERIKFENEILYMRSSDFYEDILKKTL